METFTKVKKIVDKIMSWISIAIMGIMTVLVVWQVVARKILNNPSAITEKTAQYLFVFAVMFGSALVFGENGHLEITTIKDKLKPKAYMVVTLLANVTLIFFSATVLIVGGVNLAMNQWKVVDAALQLSMGLIYLSLPLCGVCMIFYGIYNICVAIQDGKANRRPGAEVGSGTL